MKKILTIGLLLIGTMSFADSFSKTVMVKVTNSTPVLETVTEYIPVESCRDVKEEVSQNNGGTIVGTVLGGVVGGVLGHQVGGGTGNKLATVGGAVLGSIAGNKIASSNGDNSTSQVIRKCSTTQVAQERKIISGYINKGLFDGNQITVPSSSPLSEIPVTITYSY